MDINENITAVEKDWLRKALIEASHDERLSLHVRALLMTAADQILMREDIISTITSQLAEAEDRELCAAAVAISLEKDLETTEARIGERLWGLLGDMQRRSFILTPEGNGVRAVKDSSGAWLSYYEVAQLIDDMKVAEIPPNE